MARSDLRDLGFPVDALTPADRAVHDALTDTEMAQLVALCRSIDDATDEVEGFAVRARRPRAAGLELPDLPDLPTGDAQIVPANVRSLGALYAAWTIDTWPP